MRKVVLQFGLLVVAAIVIGTGSWFAADWVSTWEFEGPAEDVQAGQAAFRAGRYRAAFKIFDRLAKRGDPAAQYLLAEMYWEGYYVDSSTHAALAWWTRSAEQQFPYAMSSLGSYYRFSSNPRDYALALHWFSRAAEAGDGFGQAQLGDMYLDGRGVEQDIEVGRQWLERAIAESNNRLAKFLMGQAHRDGLFGVPDEEMAAYWCLEAGKDGHLRAMSCAVDLLAKEGSQAVDFETAYQWALVLEGWTERLGRTRQKFAEYVLYGDSTTTEPVRMVLGREFPRQENDRSEERAPPTPRLDVAGQARAQARADAVLECWPKPPIGGEISLEDCLKMHGPP